MCDGLIIDAHLMQTVRGELVKEEGPFFELLQGVIQNCHLARTPKIEDHWKTKIRNTDTFFWDWYRAQIEGGAVKDVTTKNIPQQVRRKLRSDYGLTNEPYVVAYIECALASDAPRYILGEDIHFYEPSAGGQTFEKQDNIRKQRTGSMCRYLEDKLGIMVGTIDHCKSHLPIKERKCIKRASNNGNDNCV